MRRRRFVRVGAFTGLTATTGCLGLLRSRDDTGPAEGVERDESNTSGDGSAYRIDFVDRAGTLGQVAQPETIENEFNNIVNEYAEADWQAMDDNDLQVARSTLESNDSSIDELRPHVGQEIQDSPESEPTERALMRGIGLGIKDDTLMSGSVDAANVLKPLAEKFSTEFLNNGVFEAWITAAVMPATEGRFAHLPITIAYEHNGEIRKDYVEDGVPDAPGLGENATAIRSPKESVYANPDERDMVTGFEYRKALQMAQNGQLEKEGRADPVRAASTGLLTALWNIVDSSQNDISYENPPPNGLVTHVSREFGRSVEDAFDDLTERRLGYMENVGRGMQLFYERFDGRSNLAVGGTLDTPEFYIFPDSMKETAWNFEYDDISELVG